MDERYTDQAREDFDHDVRASRDLEDDLRGEKDGGPFENEAEEDLELEALKEYEDSNKKYGRTEI